MGERSIVKPVSLLDPSVHASWMALGDWAVTTRFVGAAGGSTRVAVSSRSKLMSVLLGRSWWISTARVLVPACSAVAATGYEVKADSSAPPMVEEARVV